jgi:hypothetical protein
MGKDTNKPQMITIDGVEHNLDEMSDEQKLLVNHCLDLDRKIASTQFQLQQLQVGKDSFVRMLKDSLEKSKNDVTDVEPSVQ